MSGVLGYMYDVPRTHSQSGHRTARGARGDKLIEATRRAVVGVIVAGHDDHRLFAAWKVPEPRQRLLVAIHLEDQVGEQPLVLVSLGNADLVQIDPVRLRVGGGVTVEFVVRTLRRESVALLMRPSRVPLADVDNRRREVE